MIYAYTRLRYQVRLQENWSSGMFCAYNRPRYQVSVYRTIGPLVCSSSMIHKG